MHRSGGKGMSRSRVKEGIFLFILRTILIILWSSRMRNKTLAETTVEKEQCMSGNTYFGPLSDEIQLKNTIVFYMDSILFLFKIFKVFLYYFSQETSFFWFRQFIQFVCMDISVSLGSGWKQKTHSRFYLQAQGPMQSHWWRKTSKCGNQWPARGK